MVMVPRRPMNMTRSMVILLTIVSDEVRLSERPTVEKADTTSKMTYCVGSCGSKMESTNTPMATTTSDEKMMMKARLTVSLEMVR